MNFFTLLRNSSFREFRMKKTEPESYDFSDMGETVGIIGESGPYFSSDIAEPYAGTNKVTKKTAALRFVSAKRQLLF